MTYNPNDPKAQYQPRPNGYSEPSFVSESDIPPTPVPPGVLANQQQITNEIPTGMNYNQPHSDHISTRSFALIGGFVALVIIAALYIGFFQSRGGLDTLPAYTGAKEVQLTDGQKDQISMSVARRFGGGATGIKTALFSTPDDVRKVVQFYAQEMTVKKYACTAATSSSDYNSLNCQKEADAALVYAARVRGADLDIAPELKDKVDIGQTLIVLVVGKKPDLSNTPTPTAK